jgi:hypothetical protein
MEVELVQFQISYLLDLEVVFGDVDLAVLSSIASAVSVSVVQGSGGTVPSIA